MSLANALRSGSKDVVGKVADHLSPAVAKFAPVIADRAEGSYVWTTDGQKHLDMSGGIGVTSTGHCHPRVVKAIQEQAAKFIHAQQNVFTASVPQVALLDKLRDICPEQLTRFFFCNSGSEAVENAIKIARGHTKKQNIIAFENGFHGRTMGAMALTTSKTYYRANFGPLMPGVFIAPYPYCLHCKARQASPSGNDWYTVEPCMPGFRMNYNDRQCCNGPLEAVKWMLTQQSAPSETAAMIIEPILGEGGFLTPPPSYLRGLRELCTQHNILLIIDEVQSGVGRTGKWWGHEHMDGVDADIMTFAKGIGSGFPMAGVATREDTFDGIAAGQLGGTYGGSVLGAAAACATLDVIREEGLLENANERGAQLVKGLMQLQQQFPIIDVRGRGLMVAIEFGGTDGSLSAKYGTAAAITKAAVKRNMLLLSAGARETIRFLPALNVKAEEIDQALNILADCLEEVFGSEAQPATAVA
ncbi:hypothetical protein WJX74_007933 [Apatococcus lobatus]|uniref:4-aminobutyrate aminotransferase n=1 Tax=Apatococcus lobatus TaxID=904363 RepID=A0AAW1RZ91_9CHLO